MTWWINIVAGALKLLNALAEHLNRKQLIDAGRAVERDKGHTDTDRRVASGRAAADAQRVPDDREYRD